MSRTQTLDAIYQEVNAAHLKTWIPEDHPRYRHALRFALDRLNTGRQMLKHLQKRHAGCLEPGSVVLDVGCGNGGLCFPFAEDGRRRCFGLETFIHPEQVEVARRAGIPFTPLVGTAGSLPLGDASVDLVLYTEVIEHLEDPWGAGHEIGRVLRPGGWCLVTTPPRLRFGFRRDPHLRIFGLLCLPQAGQRWVAEKLLKRTDRYDVTHTYWSVSEIIRTLPDLHLLEITGPLAATALRRFDWEWIILEKAGSAPD